MTDLTLTFPPIPENADKSIIKPTKAFNKSIYKVVGVIIGFVLVYIFLLISVVLIAIGWGWLGYVLITGSNNILMMVLGAAFIPSGLILLYFLSKFIFVRTLKVGKGYEIHEKDHPQLFAFIKTVARETGVKPPKHIYFTPNVNASASLEINLLNTFLPGRKDLNLGLALINAINISEFKAVLAHEFGHFSQVSMRIGLYVHKLNKALYNMLYENKSYHKALNLLGNWHWTISLPIILNSYIIKCIQAILRKFYWVINKSYMELSRESEFHADAIASYLSGSNNVISLFEKHDVARYCYDQTMELLYSGLAENKKSENIYIIHSWLLKRYGEDIAPIFKPQIRVDDPWASHPSSEDRQKHLLCYSLLAPVLEESTWTLFNDPGALQRAFTAKLYGSSDQATEIEIADNIEFEKAFFDASKSTSYNQTYKGYYDNRFITAFDIQEAILATDDDHMSLETLLSNEHCDLPKAIAALIIDINTLQGLTENPNNDIRSFDYKA